MATHCSILAWKIPWTEEPGRLWSMWSQRVGRDWAHTATDENDEGWEVERGNRMVSEGVMGPGGSWDGQRRAGICPTSGHWGDQDEGLPAGQDSKTLAEGLARERTLKRIPRQSLFDHPFSRYFLNAFSAPSTAHMSFLISRVHSSTLGLCWVETWQGVGGWFPQPKSCSTIQMGRGFRASKCESRSDTDCLQGLWESTYLPREGALRLFIFGRAACGILVLRPGIESLPPAVEVQGFNYLTTREVPLLTFNIERMRLEG